MLDEAPHDFGRWYVLGEVDGKRFEERLAIPSGVPIAASIRSLIAENRQLAPEAIKLIRLIPLTLPFWWYRAVRAGNVTVGLLWSALNHRHDEPNNSPDALFLAPPVARFEILIGRLWKTHGNRWQSDFLDEPGATLEKWLNGATGFASPEWVDWPVERVNELIERETVPSATPLSNPSSEMNPHAVPKGEGPPVDVEHDCYVTRDMLANYLHVSKKKLERLSKAGKLCEPDIEGGGGKAHQWKYARIRPFLATEFARQFPERWPGEAFAFRD